MIRIRRLYDKDQEIIISFAIIQLSRFSNQRLDWGELANLEFSNCIISVFVKREAFTDCQLF